MTKESTEDILKDEVRRVRDLTRARDIASGMARKRVTFVEAAKLRMEFPGTLPPGDLPIPLIAQELDLRERKREQDAPSSGVRHAS